MMNYMTMALDLQDVPQHIVLNDVSWAYYEQTLAEIGDQPIRVAFLDGMMELTRLSPEQERAGMALHRLIVFLSFECSIPIKSFGSTTFRREDRAAGCEPDECFYFRDTEAVKDMKRFDPSIHRAPDLWIEVDLLSPSVAREVIFARLGVPEVWRYNGGRLVVRLLTPAGVYVDAAASKAFPFLPVSAFTSFVQKMIGIDDENRVLREFREWVRRFAPDAE